MTEHYPQTTPRTWDEIFAEMDRLTAPAGYWFIEWNDHRGAYETVDYQWQDDLYDFESDAEAARARSENRLVALHWYNQTPIGSYKLASPDMDGLRRLVSNLIDEMRYG